MTSTMNTTSLNRLRLSELAKESGYYLYARNRLNFTVSIIIFVLGLCGNVFILMVMRRKELAKLTVSVYLTSLAISDTCVLVFDNFINWIDLLSTDFSIKQLSDCKIYSVYYTSKLVSSWIIVSISIDRFLLVYFSNSVKKYLTKKHCFMRVMAIILVSVILNLHSAFLMKAPDNKDYHCISIDSEEAEFWNEHIWPIIETLIYSLIPSILLIVLNGFIIAKSRKAKSNFNKLWAKPSLKNGHQISTNSEYITKKINITVFAICFTFVLLTLPANIYNTCVIYQLSLIDQYEKEYSDAQTGFIDCVSYEEARTKVLRTMFYDRLLEHLMNMYHAINFFLYILSSDLFRREFYLMFSFKKNFKFSKRSSSLTKNNQVSPNDTL